MIQKFEGQTRGADQTFEISAAALQTEAAKKQAEYEKLAASYIELHTKHANNPAWNKPLNTMHARLMKLQQEAQFASENAARLAVGEKKATQPRVVEKRPAEITEGERGFLKALAKEGETWRDPAHLYELAERARKAFDSSQHQNPDEVAQLLRGGVRSEPARSIGVPTRMAGARGVQAEEAAALEEEAALERDQQPATPEQSAKIYGRQRPGLRSSISLPGSDRRAA